MSEGRWRITVSTPDWGEDHLTLDAIVAFVDDELDAGPRARAERHVDRCQECAAQVVAQTQTRSALRTAAGPQLPSSLLSSLRSIPQHADLPAAPAGLAVTEDGQLVCRADRAPRPATRTRLSTAHRRPAQRSPEMAAEPPTRDDLLDVPPDLVDDAPAGLPPGADPLHRPARRSAGQRRARFGTGVAMSGLALGALAFGATAASPADPAPGPERGVLGGTVLGGAVPAPSGLADARLRLGPGGTQNTRSETVLGGLHELRGLW